MCNALEIVFRSFWTWLGAFIILATCFPFFIALTAVVIGLPLDFLFKVLNRSLRHWNIRKYGYPPAHCDADGGFKSEDKP